MDHGFINDISAKSTDILVEHDEIQHPLIFKHSKAT